MKSSKLHVFVALLATCMLLVNTVLANDANTTTSKPKPPEPVTTKPSNTTTTITGTPITITPDPLYKCENLTMDKVPESYNLLPSEMAVIKCSCANEQNVSAICPDLYVSPEAVGMTKIIAKAKEIGDGKCSVEWQVEAAQSSFKRRRVEAPQICKAGWNVTRKHLLTFEKSTDQGKCNESIDCWSEDQYCNDGHCSCYSDFPVFVPKENKCYEATGYGRKCEFDEQCMTKDKNSFCSENVCKCQDNYRTKSKTDFTCTDSMSTILISSQVLVATATSLSMVLLFTAAF